MNRPSKQFTLPPRSTEGRLIAGICAAIGDGLAIDVTLVRLAFLILALAWGLGVILYGFLWVMMPDPLESTERAPVGPFRRTARGVRVDLSYARKKFSTSWNRAGRYPWPRPLGRRWIAIGLVVAGAVVFLTSIGAFDWLNTARAFGLALIVVGMSLVLATRNTR